MKHVASYTNKLLQLWPGQNSAVLVRTTWFWRPNVLHCLHDLKVGTIASSTGYLVISLDTVPPQRFSGRGDFINGHLIDTYSSVHIVPRARRALFRRQSKCFIKIFIFATLHGIFRSICQASCIPSRIIITVRRLFGEIRSPFNYSYRVITTEVTTVTTVSWSSVVVWSGIVPLVRWIYPPYSRTENMSPVKWVALCNLTLDSSDWFNTLILCHKTKTYNRIAWNSVWPRSFEMSTGIVVLQYRIYITF